MVGVGVGVGVLEVVGVVVGVLEVVGVVVVVEEEVEVGVGVVVVVGVGVGVVVEVEVEVVIFNLERISMWDDSGCAGYFGGLFMIIAVVFFIYAEIHCWKIPITDRQGICALLH